MKQSDHSFCVLAYNDSPFIEECIQSLRNQTVKSDILISTSTPSQFLQDLSDKYNIRLLINSKKAGISSDWTFAYNSAKSKYITLAHQDDIYLPLYTEVCLDALQHRPDSLIAFSDYQELHGNHKKNMNLIIFVKMVLLRFFFLLKNNINSTFVKRLMLSLGNPISCPGVMYNKSNIGVLTFNVDMDINLDWDAWVQLAGVSGSFIYVKKSLFLHRIHEEAESMKGIGDKRRRKEDRVMLEKMWPKALHQVMSAIYSFSRKKW